MLTSARIRTILWQRVKANAILGAIPIIKKGVLPTFVNGAKESIVIMTLANKEGQIQRAYAVIAIYVPNIEASQDDRKYSTSNEPRLDALELECLKMFGTLTYGEYQNEKFWYKLETLTTENDTEKSNSHFLNVRILFENANFKM